MKNHAYFSMTTLFSVLILSGMLLMASEIKGGDIIIVVGTWNFFCSSWDEMMVGRYIPIVEVFW